MDNLEMPTTSSIWKWIRLQSEVWLRTKRTIIQHWQNLDNTTRTFRVQKNKHHQADHTEQVWSPSPSPSPSPIASPRTRDKQIACHFVCTLEYNALHTQNITLLLNRTGNMIPDLTTYYYLKKALTQDRNSRNFRPLTRKQQNKLWLENLGIGLCLIVSSMTYRYNPSPW